MLTAAQRSQLLYILRVPEQGQTLNIVALNSRFGATSDIYDFTPIITQIDNQLDGLGDDQETRLIAMLQRWTTLTDSEQIQTFDANGSRFTDYERERAALRVDVQQLTGIFYNPPAAGNTSIYR